MWKHTHIHIFKVIGPTVEKAKSKEACGFCLWEWVVHNKFFAFFFKLVNFGTLSISSCFHEYMSLAQVEVFNSGLIYFNVKIRNQR